MQNFDYFLPTIFIYGGAQKPDEKKEDEQTLAELFQVQLIAIRKQTVS